MLYWVAATFKKKVKKDEEAVPEEVIIQPQIVVAKDEQSAAMKVTLNNTVELRAVDMDRVSVFVRPF